MRPCSRPDHPLAVTMVTAPFGKTHSPGQGEVVLGPRRKETGISAVTGITNVQSVQRLRDSSCRQAIPLAVEDRGCLFPRVRLRNLSCPLGKNVAEINFRRYQANMPMSAKHLD